MKKKLLIILFYFILVSVFSGCAISSTDIEIDQKINSKFFIGQDKMYTTNYGIWRLKYPSIPDTSIKAEDIKNYSLIFKKPTAVESNADFIIAQDTNPKSSYLIIKIDNEELVRCYKARNKKKYLELRTLLNIPETLNFK